MSRELEFQSYCNDNSLNRAYSNGNGDGEPNRRRNRASLAPKTYHNLTTDKSIDYEFQRAYAGLEALLSEEKEEGK